ncbi:hypothetical protein [Gemmatimonas sp.]|uniref:hypothetical protein n=1 Tax=Gemmatimonas sp. TaxID=1962908 RepID=UPI003DA454A8
MSIDRHLRPDEIELLLDGEEGFGVAPLRAHARSCMECQAELESARELMFALDTLPDFAPSPAFADRVMSQVQVFEPWHVAATRAVEQFVPATRSARLAAGLGAAVTAGLGDSRCHVGRGPRRHGLRARANSASSRSVSRWLPLAATCSRRWLGQPGLEALRGSSPEVMALALGGFVAVAGMGVVGIRALATSSQSAR